MKVKLSDLKRLLVSIFNAARWRGKADVSVGGRVLGLQAGVLDQLMSDAVAIRLVDSREKLDNPKLGLGLDELYTTVQDAVWSELKTGKDITGMRLSLIHI